MGIPASCAAGILAVCNGMGVSGRVLIGVAADRLGTRQAFVICFALLVASFLWLLQATGFWTIFIFAVVFGITTGASVVLFSPMVEELYGLSSHGAILGAVMMSGTAGGSLGPLLAGYRLHVRHDRELSTDNGDMHGYVRACYHFDSLLNISCGEEQSHRVRRAERIAGCPSTRRVLQASAYPTTGKLFPRRVLHSVYE